MLMVQSNAQVQMKNARVKGPPPVPPRPNQSVVAEALAKTRKSVADTRLFATKPANVKEQKAKTKAKTLERTNSTTKQSSPPKQNGLARVKSFIRDVISDRSSSSDERRSSGQNSRRSSSDSCSIPVPIPVKNTVKNSNESLNSKAVKTCKHILVRSLSSSNKLDQECKSKVTKSSSFADKLVPIRKAPPPPLSPKPKIKPLKPLIVRKNSVDSKSSLKHSPELTPYVLPLDVKKPPRSPGVEAPYATVEEVQDFDSRLKCSPEREVNSATSNHDQGAPNESTTNNNSLERKTSRVTERLINEIIASRNIKNESNAVIDKGKDAQIADAQLAETDCMPKDLNNHEILIYELQTMKSQSSMQEMSMNDYDDLEKCESESSEPNYALSSESSGIVDDGSDQAYAYILDDDLKSRLRKQYRAISTMSLHGLPPLPKSLSGFADAGQQEPEPSGTPDKPPSDLDGQLAYLKKEMAGLRQLDLSLLSELWTLSEALAAWRRQVERGSRLRPAPPPPPPPHYLRT